MIAALVVVAIVVVEGDVVEVVVVVTVGFVARRHASTAANVTSTNTANCSVTSSTGNEICIVSIR